MTEVIDFHFLLSDRIQKIKSINDMYDLEHNAYVSFSGGKDSTVLSKLIDESLPDNKIPRVYLNTGIEYNKVVLYVKKERERQPNSNYSTKAEYKNYFERKWVSIQKQRARTKSFYVPA